ncbi:hypothetical protein [Kordiimonas sp.]|uniref:hypothetical protein n=1 Tax=Kordiimonas sp. TaxID=1970157 RepID=UPI003A94EE92
MADIQQHKTRPLRNRPSAANNTNHLKNFKMLLMDAVGFLTQAHQVNNNDFWGHTSSARASVISTCLLLECAANCCIDGLKLSKNLQAEVDRFSPLSKFEYFIQLRSHENSFDHGIVEVAQIKDLQKIRNDYVHMKVKNADWETAPLNQSEQLADYGNYNTLNLPKDPTVWNFDNAHTALNAVTKFFNLYFLQWLELSASDVIELLIYEGPVELPNVRGHSIAVGIYGSAFKKAEIDFGLDFAFLLKEEEL